MERVILTELFSICQIAYIIEADLLKPHYSIARTEEGLSLVCPKERILLRLFSLSMKNSLFPSLAS